MSKLPCWLEVPLNRVIRMRSGDFISNNDVNPTGSYPVYGGNGFRGFTEHFNTIGPIVLVGRQGAHCGNVHVAGKKSWVSEHALRCFPEKKLNVTWLSYALSNMNLNQYSVSAAQPGLSVDNLKHLRTLIPPLETQQKIAQFLDEKTAKIDGLIEKKRALLERLAEKRQALITRAVTKGLNPAAPMKPSGIDWLGDIPAHWEVRRLRFSVEKIEQGWSPQCENRPAEPGEWGILKVGCVNGEHYEEAENKALPPELIPIKRYEVCKGDILISRANTKELLGSAALVKSTQGRIIFSDKLYRLHLGEDIEPRYLIGALRSPLSRFQYEQEATGTSGSMQNIGQDTIKNLLHPLPPRDEQELIGKWIGDIQKSDTHVTTKLQTTLLKLNEYRSALITAAVTGQIAGLQ